MGSGMKLSFRAHPACAVCLVGAFLCLRSDVALAALAALVCHEGFHVCTMWLCRVRCCMIELTPFGGVADVPGFENLAGWRQAAIALAGVLGSAMLACLCFYLSPMNGWWRCFFNANAALAVLNCLPLWPLDGARAALALARRLGLERAASKAMLCLSYGVSVLLVLLGAYGAWLGYVNISLFVLGPYLAYAAYESAACGHVRGMERLSRQPALKPGEVKAAQGYVCMGEPGVAQLTRLMRRTPEQRYGLLTVLDAKDGRVIETVSQKQITERVFTG